jgi:hypothetical protein
MKNLYILFFLVVSFVSFGQDTTNTKETPKNSVEVDSIKQRRNEISLEFVGLIDGRSIFGYERSFGNHWSAKIGAGPKVEEGLFNISGLDREQVKTGDINYSGFLVYLEGRYYLSEFKNGRATGFYFGAYVKNTSFQTDLAGTYIDSDGLNYNFLFDTKIGVFSGGLMLGYKLPVSKRFAVDFLIAGPGTARYSFDIENESEDLPDEFYDDVNEALEELGLLDLINADFDFSINDSSSAFSTINFRYSISLTYNF